jgi:hypothetical protein
MSEGYGPFNSGAGATFQEDKWREFFGNLISSGVFKSAKVNGSAGGDLAVSAGSGLSVNIATGVAMTYGFFYENDATLNKTLITANPSLPRIDRIVVKLDVSARTVLIVVKPGTAASSPSAPTLTQTSSIYELSLAQVRVNAGATSPTSITDERTYGGAITPGNLPSGTTIGGQTPWTAANDGSGSSLDADLLDGKESTAFVQVGAGNEAAPPVFLLVTDTLPAAGIKGRICIKVPFTMP